MSFSELGLRAELLLAVGEQGYTNPPRSRPRPFPLCWPAATSWAAPRPAPARPRASRCRCCSAAPQRRVPAHGRTPVRALILAPTRELAAQVQTSVNTYGKHLPMLRSPSVFGGVDIKPQTAGAARAASRSWSPRRAACSTTWRSARRLNQVEFLVLDEADRMLDMGFMPDIQPILSYLPKQRQTLLFSATFSDEIKQLADGFMQDPVLIEVARRNAPPNDRPARARRRREKQEGLLEHLLASGDWRGAGVHAHQARRRPPGRELVKCGIRADAIHGNKSQPRAPRALDDFKAGEIKVLVATDIAARGLDIDDLPHVINFDLPNEPETMCTASAAPAAPARAGKPFRCARRRTRLLATSSA